MRFNVIVENKQIGKVIALDGVQRAIPVITVTALHSPKLATRTG